MRARSALLLSVVLGALIGCNRNNPSPTNTGNPNGADPSANGGNEGKNVDVGPELYSLAGPPPSPPPRPMGGEPIVIPNCYVQYEDRQLVSAEVEGHIELVASPLAKRADGRYEWKQRGAEPILYDPAQPHPSIVFHPRDREKSVPYWKLSDGIMPRRRPDDHDQEKDRRRDQKDFV
jgi:hypothetical protein